MRPVRFPQVNTELTPPKGMSEDECTTLPVFCDGEHVISCWEFNGDELMEILQTGRVWLWIWGKTQPPAVVATDDPFKEEEA